MYVLTDKTTKAVVVISETLDHQENGNPLVNNGTLAIGFPVDEWTVDSVPEGVKPSTHCYDGSEFTYNPNYPFEANAKNRRDELLKETDWTQVLDAQISKESQAQMRTYRQALRDITEQDGYPYNIVWPEKPTITSGQIDPVDTAFDVLVGEGE